MAELGAGEVGFIVCGIKRIADAQIGDTVTETARPTAEPFPGFKPLKPMVFAGLYPVESHDYAELREALEKLRLNDSAFFFEPETSVALGFGFRCGFLGLLHMEIVQERLEREFDLDLVTTAPSVLYRVTTTDGEVQRDRQPGQAARPGKIADDRGAGDHRDDPHARASTSAASCSSARTSAACRRRSSTRPSDRVLITYELPFNEVVLDFYDRLKTHLARLRLARLRRHRLLGVAAGQARHPGQRRAGRRAVDHRAPRPRLRARPRCWSSKMRELIPRQMFEVAIQAAIGSRIIARETVKAMRKNVLAKCYGGDISASASCSRSRRKARSG